MTTIQQLIQTSPAKASELFAKLADTSEGAVKTRERLFTELKEEIETLASLEEEHLFPVLRKRKETKDLVQEAINDNRQTRKLLAELERTPKDSTEFTSKVAELRKTFQQHVRDDKKELLPAVIEALSDEEAKSIVNKFEDAKAEIEAGKREESEQRRSEARRQREQIEEAQQAARVVTDNVRTGAQEAQRIAQVTQSTVQSGLQNGLGTVSEMAQQSTDQIIQMFGLSGQQGQELMRHSSQNLEAVAQAGTVLTRGAQDVSREMFSLIQDRMQKNLDGLQALARCRTAQDLLAAQTDMMRNSLQDVIENSRRIAELSIKVADEASQSIGQRKRSRSAA